jgi:glycosyltransferase involved in cell wall biosynthesis
MIKISLVTPVWNGEKFISETLASIYGQGDCCFEHIIMDSLSTDRTPDIVASFGSCLTRYVREKDAGIYDAMNKGIALARGEVVGIINADDRLAPGCLARVCEMFGDPRVDYVYSDVVLIDDLGGAVGLMRALPVNDYPKVWPMGFDWRFYTPFPHPSLFVRRRVYEKLGAYDLKYKFAADHDFMARLISAGCVGVKAESPLATFRLGGASSSNLSIFDENQAVAIKYGMSLPVALLNKWKCKLGRMVK